MSDQPKVAAAPTIRARSRVFTPTTDPSPAITDQTAVDDGEENYEVGYARPPKKSQFKKGRSGNTKGRPKGSKNAKTIANEILNTKSVVTIDGKRQKRTWLEIGLYQQGKKMSEKGDPKALHLLLELAGQLNVESSVASDPDTKPQAVDDVSLEILAFHRRQELLAAGVAPAAAEVLLKNMGLPSEQAKDAQ